MKTSFLSKLIIASRKSRLAIWQAEYVRKKIIELYPWCKVEILGITTKGDKIFEKVPLKINEKGLFTKELEMAIIKGKADLAVHSLKDIPMNLPSGFILCAILKREDPRDAFISNDYISLSTLPKNAVVGTNSLRRKVLIKSFFPSLIIKSLRGNIDTRLNKLDKGEYAAIILAAAGLKRLNLQKRIRMLFSPNQILPAPGQGAIAIEILDNRKELMEMLIPLNHYFSEQTVKAERAVSRNFNGSCKISLAAFAMVNNFNESEINLRAIITNPNGLKIITAEVNGPIDTPETVGLYAAELLKKKGAIEIIKSYEKK
ncbi:hydroxymethylbilane synthase [Candidatus Profftella armatura]|uniref:Porphobilinogen deaminase n=1 Tax=Candidatus Profftella armatura TaxID=669502 RepID=S5RPS2_9PROT|nr:hydroxymethylbilane synthase [Candidatus Profftella armatura]AGS06863.1 porphobilinogen deaminase [Candidatus Profftella armatura]ALC95956.1 porphobilinogen deaminase [Candidatus Profftella armatura]